MTPWTRVICSAAAVFVIAVACSNDLDCSLNGACNQGSCDCRPGWTRDDCSALAIGTVNASQGRNGLPMSSSWGGNVLLVDGVYHLFYSRIMGDNCTLNQWETNSACWRATSTHPAGPFVDAEQIMEAFCHNTVPARAPDGTILVFHIGYGGGAPVKCSAAAASGRSDAAPGDSLPWGAPMILYAPNVTGPWSQLGPVLVGTPGAWDATITNASPWILPNGSVLLAFRGSSPNHTERLGIAAAPSWRGPYAKTVPGPIIEQQGEDPFPFVDSAGAFHLLFHDFDEAVNGGHAFAASWAGPWHYTGAPAYNRSVAWAAGPPSGLPATLARRERPMLYFDPASGAPLVLFNGATPGPGGASFTMAAGVSPQQVAR